MTARKLIPLTRAEIEGPGLTSREQSLALVAARVSAVLDARQALRDEWDRHQRHHGPEFEEMARFAVEQALGHRVA